MIQKASAMTVRQNLGELLNKIQYRHDTIVITKAGKAVAALVDMEMFEKIQNMRYQFDRLSGELANSYKNVKRDLAEKEIAEATLSARSK